MKTSKEEFEQAQYGSPADHPGYGSDCGILSTLKLEYSQATLLGLGMVLRCSRCVRGDISGDGRNE